MRFTLNSKLTNIQGKPLSKIEIIFIFLFPLLYRCCNNFVLIPNALRLSLSYLVVIASFIYVADYLLIKRFRGGSIPQYAKVLFAFFLISTIVCLLFREQSFIYSYRALNGTFLGYIYFFVLFKIKPHYTVIIRLIIIYSVIYIGCFIIGLLMAPRQVFVSEAALSNELNDSRGVFRLGIPGLAFIILLFFYSIVKTVKNNKWYIIAAISYLFIILCVVRQIIAITFFIAILFLIWKKKWLRYVVMLIAIMALSLQNIRIKVDDSSIIGNLINLTVSQTEDDGMENIRILAFKSLFSDFHQNTIEIMFGSGYAHVDSHYGQWETRNFISKGLIRADVGYAGIYTVFGVFGLLIFMLLFFKSLLTKDVGVFIFAQLFICYILLANIASWPFRSDSVEISICLYLLTLCSMRKERSLK